MSVERRREIKIESETETETESVVDDICSEIIASETETDRTIQDKLNVESDSESDYSEDLSDSEGECELEFEDETYSSTRCTTAHSSTSATLSLQESKEIRGLENPFQRRIPQSFYEKEKKKFQSFPPLATIWEQAKVNGKPLFVNHETKTTTWVDPRTTFTRVHDIHRCPIEELPYGWDEEIDPIIGVYYVDHLGQTSYLDPPWDPIIQGQISALAQFIELQMCGVQNKLAELKEQEKQKLKKKALLDQERDQIEKELEALQKEVQTLELNPKETPKPLPKTDSEIFSDTSSETCSESYKGTSVNPSGNHSQEEEEDPFPSLGPFSKLGIPKSLDEYLERLKELQQLNEKLKTRGQNEVEDAIRTQQELDNINMLLAQEAENHKRLQKEIEDLKNDIQLPNDNEENDTMNYNDYEGINGFPSKKPMSRRTRYEMEVELILLKKRLQADKSKSERLRQLQDKIQAKKDGLIPEWIRSIEGLADASNTLRIKIQRQQQQKPDQMTFRERILFFASGVADAKQPQPFEARLARYAPHLKH